MNWQSIGRFLWSIYWSSWIGVQGLEGLVHSQRATEPWSSRDSKDFAACTGTVVSLSRPSPKTYIAVVSFLLGLTRNWIRTLHLPKWCQAVCQIWLDKQYMFRWSYLSGTYHIDNLSIGLATSYFSSITCYSQVGHGRCSTKYVCG